MEISEAVSIFQLETVLQLEQSLQVERSEGWMQLAA